MKHMMKCLIIPIFIMNRGCPNRCVFCNEKITAGDFPERVAEDDFRRTVDGYLDTAVPGRYGDVQIAFYGGNFTGMERSFQEELLRYALPYIRNRCVSSIRISTRPDWIDEPTLEFLRDRHVRTIEIGAQSLDDEVLALSQRGHSAEQVRKSMVLMEEIGFERGIHLMAGLPGDTKDRFLRTVADTIALHPNTARIHPTIVFRDTVLAGMYEAGEYRPISMEAAVDWCKEALLMFKRARIPVIRLGLHTTDEMIRPGSIAAGPFHPAFRSLVEGALFLDMALLLLQNAGPGDSVCFVLSPRDSSSFRGIRNENMLKLQGRLSGASLTLREDPLQERGTLIMTAGGRRYETDLERM